MHATSRIRHPTSSLVYRSLFQYYLSLSLPSSLPPTRYSFDFRLYLFPVQLSRGEIPVNRLIRARSNGNDRGPALGEGSNNAFEREDWIRIGYENGEWNGWCVERSVGWNTMHVFPYVRCLPILDKNTLTNIADIGRESVHDINKIRARRTGTRTKTRMLVFLRLCFIFSFSFDFFC